jgi:hypothetical protein
MFDRHLGWQWAMPDPVENHCVEGIGHGDLLREPDRFDEVYQRVVLPFLRGDAGR